MDVRQADDMSQIHLLLALISQALLIAIDSLTHNTHAFTTFDASLWLLCCLPKVVLLGLVLYCANPTNLRHNSSIYFSSLGISFWIMLHWASFSTPLVLLMLLLPCLWPKNGLRQWLMKHFSKKGLIYISLIMQAISLGGFPLLDYTTRFYHWL